MVSTVKCLDPSGTEEDVPLQVSLLNVLDANVGILQAVDKLSDQGSPLHLLEEVVCLQSVMDPIPGNLPANVPLDHDRASKQLCSILLLLPIDRLSKRVFHVHSVAELKLVHF